MRLFLVQRGFIVNMENLMFLLLNLKPKPWQLWCLFAWLLIQFGVHGILHIRFLIWIFFKCFNFIYINFNLIFIHLIDFLNFNVYSIFFDYFSFCFSIGVNSFHFPTMELPKIFSCGNLGAISSEHMKETDAVNVHFLKF